MGGGDRIMIEYFKRLMSDYDISLWGSGEALQQAAKNGFKPETHQITNFPVKKHGVLGAYWRRFLWCRKNNLPIESGDTVYSASEFILDTLPVGRVKKEKRFRWIIGFYLIAPNPFLGKTKFSLNSVLFFLTQRWSMRIIRRFADQVWVLADIDRQELVNKFRFSPEKVHVISGGVDLAEYAKVKPSEERFDALFIGRFHRQKGLPDLISAWQIVAEKLARVRLGVIGWGQPSEVDNLKQMIENNNISDSIELLGFKDGRDKIALMKAAKLFVFPSHYESWGIVAIEAMAAGLPVVAYDLPIYQATFGQALIKTKCFSVDALANNIIEVLTKSGVRNQTSQKSKEMAEQFDWDRLVLQSKKLISLKTRRYAVK